MRNWIWRPNSVSDPTEFESIFFCSECTLEKNRTSASSVTSVLAPPVILANTGNAPFVIIRISETYIYIPETCVVYPLTKLNWLIYFFFFLNILGMKPRLNRAKRNVSIFCYQIISIFLHHIQLKLELGLQNYHLTDYGHCKGPMYCGAQKPILGKLYKIDFSKDSTFF